MAEEKKKSPSYLGEVTKFYFAPELRSFATGIYLGIFGFFSLYYLDNLFLAIRFVIYIVLDETALKGIGYLFTGMLFSVALISPFFISLYSIFLLHKIWHMSDWQKLTRWLVVIGIVVGGVLLIVISDDIARWAARQDVMRSFVEDANLTGRI
jgi:hypothetical protein